ncbi:MAG: hypothetical protein ABIA47_03650 [bacterium]
MYRHSVMPKMEDDEKDVRGVATCDAQCTKHLGSARQGSAQLPSSGLHPEVKQGDRGYAYAHDDSDITPVMTATAATKSRVHTPGLCGSPRAILTPRQPSHSHGYMRANLRSGP